MVFRVGDMVLYQRRTFGKGKTKKLHSVWRGPYRITHIDERGNCTLDLPKCDRRHPVFATDSLKLYHDNPENQRGMVFDITPDGEEPLYEIEKLIDKKTVDGQDFYLVHWLGYDEDEDTWESKVVSLEETAKEALNDFHKYDEIE